MTRGMFGAVFALLFSAAAFGFEPSSESDAALMKKRLVPLPVSVEFGGETVLLDEKLAVTLTLHDTTGALEAFETFFSDWFGTKPAVALENPAENTQTAETAEPLPPDGYTLAAEDGALRIAAQNRTGIMNALKTLRQLAEPVREAETLSHYYIPELDIRDFPATDFRGLHLCWFPETDPARIEQAIRAAAYYKFNYIVLEMWGTYRYEKRPEFCWSEFPVVKDEIRPAMMSRILSSGGRSFAVSKDEIRRLVEIGRSQGVTLIPQFNLFGHASASRSVSGKHAILDFHPEFQPLFEPDGWTWCLSNPATRSVLTDLTLELFDAFDSPPYFHLGCDEAFSAATCPLCRHADYPALLLDHLTYFYELFAERGCRAMMWHDMLIAPEERFKGYYAFGNEKTAGLLDRLPKEMILCDWEYAAPKPDEQWPTMRYLQEKGFDVIACPWQNRAGIESQGDLVRQRKMFGLLVTTWHHFDGGEMRTMLATGARTAWGTAHSGYDVIEVDTHLRQVGWDMKERLGYRQTGVFTWQLLPETSGPQ